MHALPLLVLCAFANAAGHDNKVLAAEQRFVDLSRRIEIEHDRAKNAFLAAGTPYPLFQAGTDLEMLSQRVQTAEIVVALAKDEDAALETAQVEYLELSGRLAAYRDLVGSRLGNVPDVQAGLKTLLDADSQASILKADLIEKYDGRVAVVVAVDGRGKVGLRVFAPKAMPPAAIGQGIQTSAAKRTLPIKVFDLPGFEP